MIRLISIVFVLLSAPASADWALDASNSTISFVSVKNGLVAEAHTFREMSGGVSRSGNAQVQIFLTSVDTLIPIRDERMRDMLFDVTKFPTARFEASVPVSDLQGMPVGNGANVRLAGRLSVHGESADVSIPVRVLRATDDTWHVTTEKPVIVQAGTFGLVEGINALREIAGLESITPAVPVTFSLVFKTQVYE